MHASPTVPAIPCKLSLGPNRADHEQLGSKLQSKRIPSSEMRSPTLSWIPRPSGVHFAPRASKACLCLVDTAVTCRGAALTRGNAGMLQLSAVVGAAALLQPGVGCSAAVAQRARAAADGGVLRVEVLGALETLVIVALSVHPAVAVFPRLLCVRRATAQQAHEETERQQRPHRRPAPGGSWRVGGRSRGSGDHGSASLPALRGQLTPRSRTLSRGLAEAGQEERAAPRTPLAEG